MTFIGERHRPRWAGLRAIALSSFVGLALLAAVIGPKAKWSFGVVTVGDTSDLGTGLRGSLKNLGQPSDEKVLLFVIPLKADAPLAADKPAQDLTAATKNVKTCVLETTVPLPPALASPSPPSYKLVLTVAGTVTDSLLVKDGKAVPPAPRASPSPPKDAKSHP